ncbi:MAG: hypothetical protein JHC95_12275 [Solirubrobacteraceae bacterium]|nr:hypothetical protein [Solirubrobacteraceae bacterium]
MIRSALPLRVRQVGAFLVGVWAMLWAARAVRWATGLDGALMNVLIGVFLVVGVVVGLIWAREVESLPAGGQSATARWGTVVGILLAVAAGFVAAKLVG